VIAKLVAAALTASTPEQAYVSAVTAMRALPIPAVVSYHSVWTTIGGGIRIVQSGTHVVLEGGPGRTFRSHAEYDIRYETGSRTIEVASSTDRLRGTGSRLFDPTWIGAYEILRYGLHGEPPATPPPAPAAEATGAPKPFDTATDPPTIASVVAISPAFYQITGDGSGVCPNGDVGRVLGLRALGDARTHPLNEVTIDVTNGLFCTMRFNLDEPGVLGVTGDYMLRFTHIGDFWLESSGVADISARVFGIAAKHVVLRWEYDGFTTAV
jgi:hypothetical protein